MKCRNSQTSILKDIFAWHICHPQSFFVITANLALQKHSCAEHQQFFPAQPSMSPDFFAGLTEAFEENQAPDDQQPPATPEKIPISIFDEIFNDDFSSKEHVAPANNGYQQQSYCDIQEIFGFDAVTKMPAMPPSYEETQQSKNTNQLFVDGMSQMELENLFAFN